MKQEFYQVLNCSNSQNEHYTATDYILQKHTPQVYQELRELKDRLKAVGKTMASELQNLEAKLFYSAYSDERIINHCIILHDSLHYADIKGMKELVLQVLWEKIKLLGYPENARFNFE